MKLTITLLAILLTSCGTVRQVQQQRGTYTVKNNKIYFEPIENWHELDLSKAPDTIFRLRNTSIRKQ